MSKTSTARKVESLAQELRGQVDTLREQIDSLQGEKDAILASLLPPHEAAQRAQSMVDTLAAKFTADASYRLSDVLRAEGNPHQSGLFSYDIFSRAGLDHTHTLDLGPMLAFFFGDEIKAKLASTIESMTYESGPPAADRPELIVEIDAELLRLERQEEQVISEAESCGFEIVRRPDANPEIVLEVQP